MESSCSYVRTSRCSQLSWYKVCANTSIWSKEHGLRKAALQHDPPCPDLHTSITRMTRIRPFNITISACLRHQHLPLWKIWQQIHRAICIYISYEIHLPRLELTDVNPRIHMSYQGGMARTRTVSPVGPFLFVLQYGHVVFSWFDFSSLHVCLITLP